MRHLTWIALVIFSSASYGQGKEIKVPAIKETVTLSQAVLRDKIKGGWAGQTIGVTFGGPTEFRYNGTLIQDYIPINGKMVT